MEGFHMVKDLVKPGDWLAKLDLKDVYFLVPIDPNHQKFLQFHAVAGQSIPVSLSAIRPILCPSYLYEVDETSDGISEEEGNQADHIPA